MAPINAALDRFTSKAGRYSDSTPSTQITRDVAPAVAALERFDNSVLRANWAPRVRADVRAMVRADAALRSDLEQIGDTRDWGQLNRDAEASSTAANLVRADLGLPPPK